MTRGVDRPQRNAIGLEYLALADTQRDALGTALFSQSGGATGRFSKCTYSGHVIGVNVRIHRQYQFQVEFPDQLQVLIDTIQHGIDDQRFTPPPLGKQVGVGRRDRIE